MNWFKRQAHEFNAQVLGNGKSRYDYTPMDGKTQRKVNSIMLEAIEADSKSQFVKDVVDAELLTEDQAESYWSDKYRLLTYTGETQPKKATMPQTIVGLMIVAIIFLLGLWAISTFSSYLLNLI